MVAHIPLTRGLFALVDDEDFPLVSNLKWHLQPISRKLGGYYAINGRGGSKPSSNGRIRMHRLILGAKPSQLVDHINGDGLDNRRCNLRIATTSENNANRTIPLGRTGFRGVDTYVLRDTRYFRAQLGRRPNLWRGPSRRSPIHAAFDYDTEAIRRFGQFARLNFPCRVSE